MQIDIEFQRSAEVRRPLKDLAEKVVETRQIHKIAATVIEEDIEE